MVVVIVHWHVPGWAAKVLQGRDIFQTTIESCFQIDIATVRLGGFDVHGQGSQAGARSGGRGRARHMHVPLAAICIIHRVSPRALAQGQGQEYMVKQRLKFLCF